jgi:hypothetical protein
MFTDDNQKVAKIFRCDQCDYTCYKKYNWDKHILTSKHKNIDQCLPDIDPKVAKVAKSSISKKYLCICGKSYGYKQSIYHHRKSCTHYIESKNNVLTSLTVTETSNEIVEKTPEDIANLTQIVLEVVKSNTEFQKQMFDLVKSNTGGTNYSHNHTNSHNKTFNLQFFLNETCKDAMNITDFVNSLQIQLSDLENVGKNGFVNGISNIIVNNLKALDYTQRPVHCSDQKRETIYVKYQNEWINDSKEQPENQKLKKAINQIAHKNICMIPEWKAKYPDCIYSDSKKSDQYNHIIYSSMDQSDANSEKIIKKIAKEVIIEK